jgi:hypothetical protein
VVFHPERCDLTHSAQMSGFEQGRDTVGKVATFRVCGWFLLELVKDRFLGVDPQDNM